MFKVTKEFIKDGKEAKTAVIYRDNNGQGMVKFRFEDEVRGTKVDTWKKWLVDARLSDYDHEGFSSRDTKKFCCFCDTFMDSSYSELHSVFKILKTDDEISFEFISSSNQYCKEKELFHDQLRLHVTRYNNKGIGERFTFLLKSMVCPNNSARMIGGMDLSCLHPQNFDTHDKSEYVNAVKKKEEVEA